MLFHSSIRQEVARGFGATLVVLATVVMTMTLIRTLGQASRGSFNPSDVLLVMGYTVLAYMPTILTMSLFISIFATLSRMYRDSEMVIWFTSGRGLSALLGPLFRFAWPVLLVIAALALLVLPWSNQRIEKLKEQYEKRGDIERVEPGQFQESAGGKRVFFVEKNAGGKQSGSNVFIATTEYGKETITSARSGRIEHVARDRYLTLSNGQRLESVVGKTELKISEFEEYGIKVGVDALGSSDFVPVNTRPTLELLKNLSLPNLAELSWRIGLILAAINFVIIGVAVSSANPRVGRSANLVFSLFAFVLYNNLLNLGQNWIAAGKFTFGGYLLALHGGALLFGAFWLAKGHNNWHWYTLWPLRTSLLRKSAT
ncbi:MAG: LPS export ABC transporter permease LptF [Rhodoferax sp.]|uniref:LPS export ABC transporter permease LptF n=1 Tax=Rhodoferax sp. TaxID=50421 RepID=UPI00260EF9F4|nr:LPS export ABC transporter permease LptF [Rhodoferax sp.]MDD5336465.1 LPS export ABC transporter permease LptF [Rhodoferax sp.]